MFFCDEQEAKAAKIGPANKRKTNFLLKDIEKDREKYKKY